MLFCFQWSVRTAVCEHHCISTKTNTFRPRIYKIDLNKTYSSLKQLNIYVPINRWAFKVFHCLHWVWCFLTLTMAAVSMQDQNAYTSVSCVNKCIRFYATEQSTLLCKTALEEDVGLLSCQLHHNLAASNLIANLSKLVAGCGTGGKVGVWGWVASLVSSDVNVSADWADS